MLEKPRYNGQVDGYPISDIQSSNGISRSREPATDTRKRVPVRSVQFRDGMTMRTFLRRIASGTISAIELPGRSGHEYRIRESEIEKYLKRSE